MKVYKILLAILIIGLSLLSIIGALPKSASVILAISLLVIAFDKK